MKSAVEPIGPTRVRLQVEVEFDELKHGLDHAYGEIAQQIRVPGFRPGKAPRPLIDQRVGRGYVLEHAVQHAVPEFYAEAVRENNVQVLGQPNIEVSAFEDGGQLVFTAEVEVRPEFEVPSYDGIEVQVDDAEPSDEEVDEQLQGMRERFATLSTVDKGAERGDHVTFDVETTVEGERIDDSSGVGMTHEIGSGQMVDEVDDTLLGAVAGETRSFNTTLKGGENAGKEATVSVAVKSVRVKELPELDDEFAQTASEFDTLDELRADIRERLARVKRLQQAYQARERILEALVNRVQMELPENFVGEEVAYRRDSLNRQLQSAGLSFEQYVEVEGRSADDVEAELQESARGAVRTQFVLDAIARKEELGVTDSEMAEQLVRRARSIGVEPEEYAGRLAQSGQLGILAGEVLRAKALALVMEHAKVTDSSGQPVDLAAATGSAPVAPTEQPVTDDEG